MAIKQTGGTKLTGIHPLSYMGVEPVSPPQLVRFDRRPTNRDFGFNIGDLWLVPEPSQGGGFSQASQYPLVCRR